MDAPVKRLRLTINKKEEAAEEPDSEESDALPPRESRRKDYIPGPILADDPDLTVRSGSIFFEAKEEEMDLEGHRSSIRGSGGGRGGKRGRGRGGRRSPGHKHRKGGSFVPMTRRDIKLPDELKRILSSLKRKDEYALFHDPVDAKVVSNYYEVIEKPMDFSTMSSKLDHGKYQKVEAFRADVDLLCDNCIYFNPGENMYSKEALKIKRIGKSLIDGLIIKIEKAEEHNLEVAEQQRMEQQQTDLAQQAKEAEKEARLEAKNKRLPTSGPGSRGGESGRVKRRLKALMQPEDLPKGSAAALAAAPPVKAAAPIPVPPPPSSSKDSEYARRARKLAASLQKGKGSKEQQKAALPAWMQSKERRPADVLGEDVPASPTPRRVGRPPGSVDKKKRATRTSIPKPKPGRIVQQQQGHIQWTWREPAIDSGALVYTTTLRERMPQPVKGDETTPSAANTRVISTSPSDTEPYKFAQKFLGALGEQGRQIVDRFLSTLDASGEVDTMEVDHPPAAPHSHASSSVLGVPLAEFAELKELMKEKGVDGSFLQKYEEHARQMDDAHNRACMLLARNLRSIYNMSLARLRGAPASVLTKGEAELIRAFDQLNDLLPTTEEHALSPDTTSTGGPTGGPSSVDST